MNVFFLKINFKFPKSDNKWESYMVLCKEGIRWERAFRLSAGKLLIDLPLSGAQQDI
jgi:hypothetical protein